jgi:hypothetical protein
LEKNSGFMLWQIYSLFKELHVPDGQQNGRVQNKLGLSVNYLLLLENENCSSSLYTVTSLTELLEHQCTRWFKYDRD